MGKLNNIKIVLSDLDGTLLRNDKTLSNINLEAIKSLRQKNIKFAIASGRPLGSVLHQLNGWKLENSVDYIIHTNGYGYYDYSNKKNYTFDGMKSEWCAQIIDHYKHFNVVFLEYDGYHIFTTDINKTVNRVKSYDLLTPQIVDLNFFSCNDFPKLVITGEKNTIDKIEVYYSSHHSNSSFHGFRSASDIFEFTNSKTSKFSAIQKLCLDTNIPLDCVLVFGDEENDRIMLTNIYHSVAMENASESIKKIAKYETLSNENNGFSHFINNNILK